MIRTNTKRSATHWRVLLLFLGFLGSVVLVSPAPADPGDPSNSKERTSSLSSPRRSSEQDIGSPSELAWQAWLLVDAQPSGSNIGLDSASILRRITPKSVFIAPSLQACADGYKADNMGRCQKIVNIDHEAHLNFLVQRLNQLYGKGPSQAANTSTDKKQSPTVTGPLQLNIPLLPAATSKDKSSSQVEERPQVAIPLETRKEVSVDYRRNDTRMSFGEKHEESFSLDSNSTDREKNNQESSSPAFVVPVVDFIDEANETFSEIVDYKIPLGLQAVPSRSIEHDLRKQDFSTTEETLTHQDNTTTTTSTTTTRTMTMFSRSDQISEDDSFRETVTARLDSTIENVTESPFRKEMIIDGVSDIDSEVETWKNESVVSSVQGTLKNETSEADILYEEESEPDLEDQEEYSDTTQVSEEDLEESEDEILKHGETAMVIPLENQALIRSEETKKRTQIPKDDFLVETTTFLENDSDSITSTTTETGEDLGSNVSSEVSVNKDFVLETTLLGVNTGKVKNSTKPVFANNTASHQNREDDLKAFFEAEKKFIAEPEVVFSPQDNRGPSLYGRKRNGQILKSNFQFINESHDSTITQQPMTSNATLHPALIQAETRPIEEQASFQSEKTLPSDSNNNFSFQSPNLDAKPPDLANLRPISVNRDGQGLVRFPNYERRRQGYVRFPSDDVNSIHSSEIKQRFPHLREEYPNSPTSTKSSVSFNQKQSNWWIPSPPRMDRQQTFIHAQTSQNQSPMLLRFWARMPLLRDPSLDPSFSTPSDQTFQRETVSRSSRVSSPSRRNYFYKENSPRHEVKRVFPQNVQSSIRG